MTRVAILDAVSRLQRRATNTLLDERPDLLTVRDRHERNLLQLACSVSYKARGVSTTTQVALARDLLDRGVDIDEPAGRDKCTALFEAVARARNPKLVAFLLSRGATTAAAPGGGLFAAVWHDDLKTLELLLDAGADIDVVVGVTPFHAAWGWKKFRTAKALAVRGANVDFQDSKGKTALHIGVEKEYNPALLKWLVQHGASPDIEDRTGVTPRARAGRKRDKAYARALQS